MQLKRNKLAVIIALFLMLSMTLSMVNLQSVNAVDISITNYAFLVVAPNPIGQGQTVAASMWLDKLPPLSWGNANTNPAYDSLGQKFHGFTLTIQPPTGSNITMGPYTSDYTGAYSVRFTPDQIGTYHFTFVYPGEIIQGIRASGQSASNDTYLPATSHTVALEVTQEPIQGYQSAPLPTSYWERPIYGLNREWAQLGGNWFGNSLTMGSGCNSTGAYNPYSTSPQTAHIMYTKQMGFGGIVGGADDRAFYNGLSYEESWNPPNVIILAGRVYLQTRSDTNAFEGVTCFDLRTGQEYYFLNASSSYSFGQLFDYESFNEHGVLPYLWQTGSTMNVYNGWNGQLAFHIVNATTSSKYTNDDQGDVIGFSISNNRLIAWNSTKALYPSGTVTFSPSQTTNYSWANGIMYNVSVPANLGTMVTASGGIILLANEFITSNVRQVSGLSQLDGSLLWQFNMSDYNQRAQYNFSPVLDGYFAWYKQETKQYYGYEAQTGKQVWVSDAYPNDFAEYFASYRGAGPSDPTVGYGCIFTTTYDGTIHCNSIKNGTELWSYYTGSSGFENPYGTFPFYGGATVGGGAVFAGSNEHTPNDPLWRGSQIWAVNATTGQKMWSISAWMPGTTLVDGYLSGVNYYDMKLYTFGKGLSTTTVSASPKTVSATNSIVIEGTVTDQTPDSHLKGTAAVSDDSMTAQMEYLFQQQPKPTNATGVPVSIDAIDPNNNFVHLGDAVSDGSGYFSYAWNTPNIPGKYTIIATFAGSGGYYSSVSETSAVVESAPAATPAQTQAPQSMADMYFVPAIAGILVAIIIVGVALAVLMLRKRP